MNNDLNTKNFNLFALSEMSVIEVSGDDSASFFQRLLTSDISEVTPNQSQFSALLNPKGRVIANFLLTMRNDRFYIVVDKELVDSLVKRLRLYVLRAKVNINLEPGLGFFGCRQLSEVSESELPKSALETQTIDEFTVVKMPGVEMRFGVFADSSYTEVVDRLPVGELWQLQDIEAGIPWLNQHTSELFIAQAINLDLIGGVSWTKGCYPGQEIVARLHYRGGINRRMVSARSSAESKPVPGTEISCPDLPGNQTGTVVNFVIDADSNQASMLISVPIKFIDQENLLLSDTHPLELQIERLPYSIPELENTKSGGQQAE